MQPFAKLFEHPELGQILVFIDTQELKGHGDVPCLSVKIDPGIDGIALGGCAVLMEDVSDIREALAKFDEEHAVEMARQIRHTLRQRTGEVGELRA